MVTLFRSGSYHITGGNSLDETERMKDWMVGVVEDLGIETLLKRLAVGVEQHR
jgi:TATA-box binding protein (TBP) (component of TFIID and TFIIIB)